MSFDELDLIIKKIKSSQKIKLISENRSHNYEYILRNNLHIRIKLTNVLKVSFQQNQTKFIY